MDKISRLKAAKATCAGCDEYGKPVKTGYNFRDPVGGTVSGGYAHEVTGKVQTVVEGSIYIYCQASAIWRLK